MSSISSEIRWNSFAGVHYLHLAEIDSNTFQDHVIYEFRRGRSIFSFDMEFTPEGADGGEIWAKKEYLEQFLDFICKNRKEFELRDDL